MIERMRCTAALLLVLLGGCGTFGKPHLNLSQNLDTVTAEEVALDLYLIGDAGLPNPAGEPVLQALRQMLERSPTPELVVFLGDNVYPAGLPDADDRYRREAERILDEQLEVLRSTGTRGVFVPGNHDWDAGGRLGWLNVVRQERYLIERGAPLVDFQPRYGCPGPAVLDVDSIVRLVFLNTQWWLHEHTKPQSAEACAAHTDTQVLDSLRTVLRPEPELPVVVTAHHPLVSAGEHGGYFDWPTYLFPVYPWARILGFGPQDVGHLRYRQMSNLLSQAFAEGKPLIYAAGHEHNLQVLERDPAEFLLVSGAGIYGHTTKVRAITGTHYVRRVSGFMRVTFLRNGGVRLGVIAVEAPERAVEDFSMWLRRPE